MSSEADSPKTRRMQKRLRNEIEKAKAEGTRKLYDSMVKANNREIFNRVMIESELVLANSDGSLTNESAVPLAPLISLLRSINIHSTSSDLTQQCVVVPQHVSLAKKTIEFDWHQFLPVLCADMYAAYYEGVRECVENIVKLDVEPRWLHADFSQFMQAISADNDRLKSEMQSRFHEESPDRLPMVHAYILHVIEMLRRVQLSTSSSATTHLFAFCDEKTRTNPLMARLGKPNSHAHMYGSDTIVQSIYAEFDLMLYKRPIVYVCGFAQINLAVRRFFSAYMATKSSRLTLVTHPIMATIATCSAALNSSLRKLEEYVITYEMRRF